MTDLVFILVALAAPVIVAAGFVRAARLKADRAIAWDAVARALGLTREAKGLRGPEAMSGLVDGVPVRILLVTKNKAPCTRLEVGGPAYPLPELTLRAEASSGLGKVFQGDDRKTGDHGFDVAVFCEGQPLALRALLDHEVRAVFGALISGQQAVLAEQKLTLDLSSVRPTGAEMAATLRRMLAAMHTLKASSDRAADMAGALAHHARGDTAEGVRHRCFEVLVDQFADDPRTGTVAEAMPAFDTPEREIRRLMQCTDTTARAGLEALARENLPRAQRGAALRSLVQRFDYRGSRELVLEALDAPSAVDRLAALALVAAAGDTEQVPRLSARMLREDDLHALAFAETLGKLGDARAENALLSLLARESEALQRVAAVALGRLAGVRAVEHLLPLTEGLLRAGPVKEAARDAVRRIQARLGADGAVGAGRVSLAEDTGGRVSVAAGATTPEAGAVGDDPERAR